MPAPARDPYAHGTWFEPIADFVAENYLEFDYTKGTAQEARFLRDCLALTPGARVLDVACGIGRHALELGKAPGARVTGFDLSRKLLAIARERARHAKLPLAFARADARRFPFKDASFDAAYCLCEGAFGLLGDMRPFADPNDVEGWDYAEFVRGSDAEHVALLKEVRRVLRPGGQFLLSALHTLALRNDPNFDPVTSVVTDLNRVKDPKGKRKGFMVPVRCFTAREITAMMNEAGLHVVGVLGGTTGDYGTMPLVADDPEVLVLAERPA